MGTRKWAICAAAIFLASRPDAIKAADEKPEGVVAKALAAMQKDDWDAVSALVHPDVLSDCKADFLECLEGTGRWAKYSLLRPDGAARAELLRLFGENRTANDIRQFDPSKVFAVLLRHTQRDSELVICESSIIGSVFEEATRQAYVVYRIGQKLRRRAEHEPGRSVEMATVLRSGDSWRIKQMRGATPSVLDIAIRLGTRTP